MNLSQDLQVNRVSCVSHENTVGREKVTAQSVSRKALHHNVCSFSLVLSLSLLCLRQHNKIGNVDGRTLTALTSLETLDLSNNDITELRVHCFPLGLQIRDL